MANQGAAASKKGSASKPKSSENGSSNGHLPIGSVTEILERAPSDLTEEIVDVPEWECAVKIRTLTANERGRVRQVGMDPANADKSWSEMEVQQFLSAVVEPKFTEHQVRKLMNESGSGFARVIAAHDILSSMSKEEIRKARKEFRGQSE